MANAAQAIFRRMAAITQPANSLQRFGAFSTIRVHGCALLIELADVGQPRQFDHLICDVPQLVPA